jgi:hypothetical protein
MQKNLKKQKLLLIEPRNQEESRDALVAFISALRGAYDCSLAISGAGREVSSEVHAHDLTVFPLTYTEDGGFERVRYLRELYELCKVQRFDIVHVFGEERVLAGGLAAFLARTPKIVLSVSKWRLSNEVAPFRRWLAALNAKLALYCFHHIIVEREGDYDLALAYHIAPPRKLLVAGPPPLSADAREKILWAYQFSK